MSDSSVFFSDDMGFLADCLARQLFPPGAKPFAKRLVIVPGQSTKNFLQEQWAKKENLGIAAGVEILDMHAAFAKLASSAGKKIPSALELSLRLFQAASSSMPTQLLEYVDGKEERLFPLCQEIARLFLDYGLYGEGQLELWIRKGSWQAKLWEIVWQHPLTYPLELFGSSSEIHHHLFGFFSLPPAAAHFFKQTGATFYFFSPCTEFWGDFVSDKTGARQALFFQRKGVVDSELSDFEQYIENQHPLLANWGQAGRRLLEVLKTEEMECEAKYKERKGNSKLQHVQRSILALDTVADTQSDDSLRIFSAPSRARELEALLDDVQAILMRHETMGPKDILVLAPDINHYTPYIQAVFGSDESPIGYSISGIERIRTSSLAQALRGLLNLLEERFDAKALLSLFRSKPFREKRRWEDADLARIAKWIEKAKITWGYDGKQRALIVHANDSLAERGSFSFGLDRLLFGLACEKEGTMPAPLSDIEWAETELFAQLLETVEELQKDVEFLSNHEKRSLAEWTAWTGQLFERYLSSEEDNWLYDSLTRLRRSVSPSPSLHFSDFCRIVDSILSQKSGHLPNPDLQSVRFASLAEGEVHQARVICLLGMEEGPFPRVEKKTSLTEVSLSGTSASESDRFLLLEALIKSGDYLRISYLNRSVEEKTDLMPNIAVQELIDWQGLQAITIPALGISKEALAQFPFFSTSRRHAAELYYEKSIPTRLPQVPIALPHDEWPEEEEVRLEDVSECLRNSLSFYFSKVLKFRLKKEDEEDFATEEFCLPSWEALSLARESLSHPLTEVVEKAKRRGGFPLEEFEEVAVAAVRKKVDELHEQLGVFDLSPEECITVIMSRSCTEPKTLPGSKLLIPAWQTETPEGRTLYITGEIEWVFPQGIACFAKDKADGLLPFWPHYLVLSSHPNLNLISPSLLPLGKKEKFSWPISSAQEEMAKLLLYYKKAKTLISPLQAKSISKFLSSFEKWENEAEENKDLYAKWLLSQQGSSYAKGLFDLWRPYVRETLSVFLSKFENINESS